MKRFSRRVLATIGETKYFYLRAGDSHRFTPVWVVVVEGWVLVRPWNDRPGGWHRAFLADPQRAVKVGKRVVAVHAGPVKGAKLLDAMEAAYAQKYTTKANTKYVKRFRDRSASLQHDGAHP